MSMVCYWPRPSQEIRTGDVLLALPRCTHLGGLKVAPIMISKHGETVGAFLMNANSAQFDLSMYIHQVPGSILSHVIVRLGIGTNTISV